MTYGDYIRSKSDKELAKMLINTVDANSDMLELYVICLGEFAGDYMLHTFDEQDLEDMLSCEIEERED